MAISKTSQLVAEHEGSFGQKSDEWRATNNRDYNTSYYLGSLILFSLPAEAGTFEAFYRSDGALVGASYLRQDDGTAHDEVRRVTNVNDDGRASFSA